jgi:hypothetical protein
MVEISVKAGLRQVVVTGVAVSGVVRVVGIPVESWV